MLQFIFGRPGTGKTYTVMEKIKASVLGGEQVVLIVPEQFSFESEKAVLHLLGDSGAQCVSVMSFTRLFDEVGRGAGMLAGRVLSESDQLILMRRAITASLSEISDTRVSRSVSYASVVLDTVKELKINAVTTRDLRDAAAAVPSEAFRRKLLDLAVIAEKYDLLAGEQMIDPSDILTRLYDMLEIFPYFEGKTVYFDSFKGFTGQQYKIIRRIFAQAEQLFFSFTFDPDENREYDLFSNVGKAVRKIRQMAAANSVPEEEALILWRRRCRSASLIGLERLMSGKDSKVTETDGGITVCCAENPYEEAAFAASTIRRLIREENIRLRDIVIIARDAADYQQAVEIAARENDISCFTDKRIPLSGFPAAIAVKNAVAAAGGLASENILRFHKTGLGLLSEEEVSVLENYVYLWNIDGSLWKENWDMDVRGFVSQPPEPADVEALRHMNVLRKRAIEPILRLAERFRGSPRQMAQAIVRLMEDCDFPLKLREISGSGLMEYDSCFRRYMEILDSLVVGLPEDTEQAEFCEMLELAVRFADVGVIPQTLDEVTFGSADRIRPSRPKVVFILGANQGVFPRFPSKNGIFTGFERKLLTDHGIPLGNDLIEDAIDEDFLVYTNLCSASERLYICYSGSALSGESLEKSAFVSRVENGIPCMKITYPGCTLSGDSLPQSKDALYARCCKEYGSRGTDYATLRAALEKLGGDDRLSSLEAYLQSEKTISPSCARELYGKDLHMSASRIESFSKCPFSYFCRYGLKVEKLRPAEFNALQRGTVIHYVFERFIGENRERMSCVSPEECNVLVDRYIREYLESIAGYHQVENAYFRFLVERISALSKEAVRRMAEEFAQSKFRPVGCEVKIGGNQEIPALRIPYDQGDVVITGSIDRMDAYNGYIRVVDYKTGTKKFAISDVLYGLNLQMLLYLYAALKSRKNGDKAAGILYMKPMKEQVGKKRTMKGMLLKDLSVVTAMEAENQGEYVPKLSVRKDGELYDRGNTYVEKEVFDEVFRFLDRKVAEIGNRIAGGDIAVKPIDSGDAAACKYCDFGTVCGGAELTPEVVEKLSNSEAVQRMKEVTGDEV